MGNFWEFMYMALKVQEKTAVELDPPHAALGHMDSLKSIYKFTKHTFGQTYVAYHTHRLSLDLIGMWHFMHTCTLKLVIFFKWENWVYMSNTKTIPCITAMLQDLRSPTEEQHSTDLDLLKVLGLTETKPCLEKWKLCNLTVWLLKKTI